MGDTGRQRARTWLITGTSSGLGREFTIAALARGDRVAATARDVSTLADLRESAGDRLLPITLDVIDRSACFAAVGEAVEAFGALDVVVNNAGYAHLAAFEELSEADLRDQLEVNLFGPLRITQAALPYLRAQRHGHIIAVSSIAGIGAFPNMSAYSASKWALEAMTESLADEVAPFGIRVTVVEPGPFATNAGAGTRRSGFLSCYEHVRVASEQRSDALTIDDPATAAQAMLDVVDAENPPLRVIFGGNLDRVNAIYRQRLEVWNT